MFCDSSFCETSFCEEFAFIGLNGEIFYFNQEVEQEITFRLEVEIDYELAITIAHVVNDAAEKYNVKESVCDAGNITANNIKDLIVLAGINLKSEEELDNEL